MKIEILERHLIYPMKDINNAIYLKLFEMKYILINYLKRLFYLIFKNINSARK